MDPIRPNQPNRPGRPEQIGPTTNQPVKKTGKTGKKFEVGRPTPAEPQRPVVTDAQFEQMRRRVLESLERGQTKEQALRELIAHEAKAQLGDHATESVISAIEEQVRSDPVLRRLSHRLIEESTRSRG